MADQTRPYGTCGTHATVLPCEECRAEVKRMHAEWKASGVCAPPLCTLPSGHAGAHAKASPLAGDGDV